MYHMLTGQPPYPDGTALAEAARSPGKTPPDPRSLNSTVPVQLSAIMRKMTASNPDQRYQAAGLLLNDLIQLASLLGLHTVPAEGIVWKKLRPTLPGSPIGGRLGIRFSARDLRNGGGTAAVSGVFRKQYSRHDRSVGPSENAC
ncbi:MAG UNVERIFIED_CONTAM: hypothetical protein LVR18_18685 [Planctomycetaceae bacterium]|jgi:serine/threonine protein kinase